MSGYLFLISLMNPSRRSMPERLVWSWTMTPTFPEPPMSAAILWAASAAAATLSVAAVVTGMKPSTPASNPITGIFCFCALCSRGTTAALSRASMHNAEGCFASAALSRSTCWSTMDSFSGPSNVTITL